MSPEQSQALSAPHFIRGTLVEGDAVRHRSRDLGADFTTPAIDLDAIVMPRSELPPLLDIKLSEIIDFLVEVGERLHLDRNPYLQECLEYIAATNPLPRRVVENLYREAPLYLSRQLLESMVESNFANREALDGWVERTDPYGSKLALRAFPPRIVHMLAGNAPAGCVASIAQGAIVKAVNLFKMPSSDPFTTVAVLRTMADIDPSHPVVRSMTAVYWQGGDEAIERTLYRPQYFDKIVAWGGGPAINNVIKYLGPGIQLVSFDPKSSISMIGREAFASAETMDEVAERLALDTTVFNQEACLASRFVFVEGEQPQIEVFCAKLADRLAVDRDYASAVAQPLSSDVREEVEVMSAMGELKSWGGFDGRGLVILSDTPVNFHPSNKTSNIVMVNSLDDAIRCVNVATQTIGIYPVRTKGAAAGPPGCRGCAAVVPLGNRQRPRTRQPTRRDVSAAAARSLDGRRRRQPIRHS
jgi:Acyl-CoA reductase (LuxC)